MHDTLHHNAGYKISKFIRDGIPQLTLIMGEGTPHAPTRSAVVARGCECPHSAVFLWGRALPPQIY